MENKTIAMYVAQPIQWTDCGVVILDQRRLPGEEISHTYTDYREVARAIREMVIRGAPAIGVAAAMGVALGVLHSAAKSIDELRAEFPQICHHNLRTYKKPNNPSPPKPSKSISRKKPPTKPSAATAPNSCPAKAK